MSVIDEIRSLASPLMTAFQSDLEHDSKWIEAYSGRPFIHITRESGTECIGLPLADELVDDNPVPHLFGRARPSEILRQTRQMLLGPWTDSGKLWLYFDGKRLQKSSSSACVRRFDEALAIAKRNAKRMQRCA